MGCANRVGHFLSLGNLISEKVDRGPNFRKPQPNLLPVKEGATAEARAVPFVAVQDVPDGQTENTVDLYPDKARLLQDAGISILSE